MGWVIAVAGMVFTLINPEVGLLIFVVGLTIAIFNGTSWNKSSSAVAKPIGPFGALIMLIAGAVLFMMIVAAFVGAVGSL